MTYYIDFVNGKKENNGLTQKDPINYYKELDLEKGDIVLFKRGTFVRDRLYNKNGISYGAYGEGENPIFCGSVDVCDQNIWENTGNNIWKLCKPIKSECCNFILDNDLCGVLKWDISELKKQGDWFDNCFGYGEVRKELPENHNVYMYSKKNPAEVYTSIECVLRVYRQLASNGHDMEISDLTFINNGVHGIAGECESKNLHIKNCHFSFIGGSVWSEDLKIRFGNGVECWDICENVTVENCTFNEIYDSAVTHQGGINVKPADGFIIKNNVFTKCGMAAYEQRDVIPKYAVFNNNICKDAGKGFSHYGIELPRQSEIYPQPMGHHIFLWRIKNTTENAKFEIKGNTFGDAPYGCAIYSIISTDAEKQIKFVDNKYEMKEKLFYNRLGGKNIESL